MNLRQLQIFYSVCKFMSMSEAGREMFISQPAISQTISDLETELNIRLFDRMNKKLNLTHAGEVLLTYSKRILNLVDEAHKEITDIANMNKGKLRIGASTTIGIYMLPSLINEFQKQQKNIEITYEIDNTGEIEEKILNNRIDIGLVEGPIKSTDIVVKHYLDDELYLICSKNHRFAKERQIKPDELQYENIIIREEGSGTRVVFEEEMLKNNYPYRIQQVLNSTEAIKKAVAADLGIAVTSKITIEEELKSGLIQKVNIEGVAFKRPLNIIYHKDKYRSTLFEAFTDFLSL